MHDYFSSTRPRLTIAPLAAFSAFFRASLDSCAVFWRKWVLISLARAIWVSVVGWDVLLWFGAGILGNRPFGRHSLVVRRH